MEITATLIKQLRDKTGAGMMECKTVLTESDGDLGKAEELLKKRGLARASKLSSRETKQGLIDTYVHGGRIGAMIEINCETDFVSRNEGFRELAHELVMQVAATNPQYVDRDSVPAEMQERIRAEFTDQAKAEGKPERVMEQIVQGKLDKHYQEICLLEQPWVKEPERVVGDLVKQFSAKTGENVRVNRFTRYELGG